MSSTPRTLQEIVSAGIADNFANLTAEQQQQTRESLTSSLSQFQRNPEWREHGAQVRVALYLAGSEEVYLDPTDWGYPRVRELANIQLQAAMAGVCAINEDFMANSALLGVAEVTRRLDEGF